MIGVIYKVTNNLNGKVYIGQKRLSRENFIKSRYFGSGKYIKLSIKKYGLDNFSREVLDECDSQDKLDEKEKYWIGFYGSLSPNGYNIVNGAWGGSNGGQNKGIHWSSEVTKKTSETLKKKYASGEITAYMKGRTVSEDTKDKIRSKRKNQIFSRESIDRAVESRKETAKINGYWHTEETKKIISEKKRAYMIEYYKNGGISPRLLPRETRICGCGCGESFECKITSKRKYLKSDHAIRRKK